MSALECYADQRVRTLVAIFLTGQEPARHLAMETLKLMGPEAETALPVLREELFHGPWKNRNEVASTLAEMGPCGVAILLRAACCGDPVISEPAFRALDQLQNGGRANKPAKQTEIGQVILLTLPVQGVSSRSNVPASSNRPHLG